MSVRQRQRHNDAHNIVKVFGNFITRLHSIIWLVQSVTSVVSCYSITVCKETLCAMLCIMPPCVLLYTHYTHVIYSL